MRPLGPLHASLIEGPSCRSEGAQVLIFAEELVLSRLAVLPLAIDDLTFSLGARSGEQDDFLQYLELMTAPRPPRTIAKA